MDRLGQLRVLVQVAEMGSFIKAARALDVPRATVSAAVQALEAAVGTRLLHRTTRHVRPTVDGVLLLERARTLLSDADALERLFRSRHSDVAGRLRVDVPSRIARRLLAPALPSLFRRHPQLHLALGSADRQVDLVQEGVDCAIRVGTLSDSSLVVRPLGQLALINCASPAYLRAHGTPLHPDELARGPRGHLAVGYASSPNGRELPFEHLEDGHERSFAMASQVVVNNAESYIACCRAGLGLIQVPRFDVQYLLDRGELVEVMPRHRAASMPVSALYPHRRHRSQRLNVFVDWVGELLAPHLEPAIEAP